MTKRRNSRVRSDRPGQLAHYFPSLSTIREALPQWHMFTEDVTSGLMPHPRIRGSTNFLVSFGDVPVAAELLQSFTRNDNAYSQEQLVCDAVNEIGLNLSWQGRAIYQIAQDETDRKVIRLRYCTPQRLYRLPGVYLHHVPTPDREEFHAMFIVASRATVWDLGMPAQLGGTKGYFRILKGLKRYKGTFPSFVQDDLRSGRLTAHFQSSEYIRYREAEKSRITSLWGWPRRNSSLDHETEFFNFYRTITFRWAQAILRDHIITELNVLLKRLQINAQIAIQGLPTPDSILEVRQQMMDGNISFGEALRKTSIFAFDE